MKLSKCLKHAFSMVVHSRLRSWLTILGIVIGVAAVISIISLGEGMQSSLDSQTSAGADLVTITPGYTRGAAMFGPRDHGGDGGATSADSSELNKLDYQALRTITEIELISRTIQGKADISFMGETGSVTIQGVDQQVWPDITTTDIAEGRMLDSADKNVVLIGGSLADGYFEKDITLNKMITIEGNAFRVVGILDDTSRDIYMPLTMAYQVIDDSEVDVYDKITVKVKNVDEIDAAVEVIDNKLMLVRHVTESTRDFTTTSSLAMQATRAEMMSTMNTFLLAIAAVSLIVGAVGVANSMFTSVLEKTKEIGIMKAIGAKNRDILTIFLLNSALIGFVGGFLGLVLGMVFSSAIPTLLGDVGMFRNSSSIISLNSVFLAISVSVVVGIVSGFIPAYQASRLKPVDALRYE